MLNEQHVFFLGKGCIMKSNSITSSNHFHTIAADSSKVAYTISLQKENQFLHVPVMRSRHTV